MKNIIVVLLFLTLLLDANNDTKNQNTVKLINKLVKKYHFKKSYIEEPFSKVVVQKRALRIFSAVKRVNRTFAQIVRLKKLYPKYGAWDRYVKVSV